MLGHLSITVQRGFVRLSIMNSDRRMPRASGGLNRLMRLDPSEARGRFAASRVLRMATAGADLRPHLVPCTFVVDGAGRVAIGIDDKPKSSPDLRRLRNIAENPRVSLIADYYEEDWDRLWWARADGTAVIERSGGEHAAHWDQLIRKYPQYAGQTLTGPVIVVTVTSWSGWAFR
jgi:PPOX class probable F420-dependent enzyme